MHDKAASRRFALFTYDLRGLSSSQKVRFVYAVRGRPGKKGILAALKGKVLADSCFLVHESQEKKLEDVFHYWKVSWKKMRIMLID